MTQLKDDLDAATHMADEQRGYLFDKDNWAHRSEGMRCATCMWFVAKQARDTANSDVNVLAPSFGRCRRRAPTMNGWPAMFGTDFCGDHKLDENKLGADR